MYHIIGPTQVPNKYFRNSTVQSTRKRYIVTNKKYTAGKKRYTIDKKRHIVKNNGYTAGRKGTL